jgi:hypothetical protein
MLGPTGNNGRPVPKRCINNGKRHGYDMSDRIRMILCKPNISFSDSNLRELEGEVWR